MLNVSWVFESRKRSEQEKVRAGKRERAGVGEWMKKRRGLSWERAKVGREQMRMEASRCIR